MTWIVGTVPPFGYSLMVADVRVSWADGMERDCLQKIHQVGEDYIYGFAGSVRIGFILLGTIAEQLPSKRRRGPVYVAQDWIPSLCRKTFSIAPPAEKKLGCQLMLAAAHPTENLGDVPWSRTYVWTFTYPDFAPVMAGPKDVLGIGNGSVVPTYMTALSAARNEPVFLQLITHSEGEQVSFLAREMHQLVRKTATRGVSPYMQMAYVTRGKAMFGNHNYKHFEADGGMQEIRVPPTASTYREFSDFCKRAGLSAAAAVC